jgi:hypothetical protein
MENCTSRLGAIGWAVLAGVFGGATTAAAGSLAVGWLPERGPELRWTDGGEVLESSESLNGPWLPVAGAGIESVRNGAEVRLTDRREAGTRFYRLRGGSALQRLAYVLGQPSSWRDVWVDPVAGEDDGDDPQRGRVRTRAFRTLAAAWRSLPEGTQSEAIRFRLLPGTHIGAYLESRRGTAERPIVIEPADGPGTVVFRQSAAGDQGSIQFVGCGHVAVQDLRVDVRGGDAMQCEACEYMLLRRLRLNSVRSEGQDETLKLNQSRHCYIEDCEITDAGDNCIDVVGVQQGHIVRCRIGNSGDWGAYLKGGSAHWIVADNEIFGCGTGGFTAGQGSGFQFMVPPYVHYEAYDVKVFNNLIHDCEGAGLGVNGGYNILFAHNTCWRVGSRSHLFEAVHGRRGCDGGEAGLCEPLRVAGGWGTSGEEEQYIPNRHVWVYNNLFLNPADFANGGQLITVAGPATPPAGSNVASPARADDDLIFRGNVFWSLPEDTLLGVGDPDGGCVSGSCTPELIRSQNAVNRIAPDLVAPGGGDFRPREGSVLSAYPALAIPSFSWVDAPTSPPVPQGMLENVVAADRAGRSRVGSAVVGALLP